ncbi:MAG: hypothetical protein MHPSP_003346, partial [Paramarteilia canceri]
GKTNLITRYVYKTHDTVYIATVGIDFLSKSASYRNCQFRLHIWDTAGQERFRTLIPSYIRQAHCILVCFDITNRDSFEKIPTWLEMINKHKTEDSAQICLVGTKSDLESTRVVTSEEAQQFANERGMSYNEVSALNNVNVEKLFESTFEHLPIQELTNNANGVVNGGAIDAGALMANSAVGFDAKEYMSKGLGTNEGGMCGCLWPFS